MIQKYVYALREVCQSYYPALECFLEKVWVKSNWDLVNGILSEYDTNIIIYCRYCGLLYRASDYNRLCDLIRYKQPAYRGNSIFHDPCLKCEGGELFQNLMKGTAEGSKELFQLSLLVDQSV